MLLRSSSHKIVIVIITVSLFAFIEIAIELGLLQLLGINAPSTVVDRVLITLGCSLGASALLFIASR